MFNHPKYRSRAKLAEWKALSSHKKKVGDLHIKTLFEENPARFEHYHLRHENIMLDYSKQPITPETLDKLMSLAKACNVENWRHRMFTGQVINTSENRAVLHTALRTPDNTPVIVEGEDIIPQIRTSLARMKKFCDKLRKEKKFTHIVNIGIGGSDLAPAMVHEALKYYSDRDIHVHFVSNMDGTNLVETLRLIDPEKTLFIITSKTFTTQETMANAHSARQWLRERLGVYDVSKHFIAASLNIEATKEFGIDEEHVFPIWDWVGGRFSLWSTIGLSFCIAIGFDNFQALLDGAHSMDQHFLNAPMDKNMPILMAMIGIWHRNFMDLPTLSITPYDQYLRLLVPYLQQLDMESNGKAVDRKNRPVTYKTGPVVLGDIGTNAQHAYFQILHQGSTIVPSDFILVAKTHNPIGVHHKMLLSNALAQSKALMEGKKDADPHRCFEGNRPSNTIVLDELTPYTLGLLLALYEHKIFVQGIIWNINSFDQCGVELGKTLAGEIIKNFDKDPRTLQTDSSTCGILEHLKSL
ncbi:MAG: glucose-6-phosphate isomerase [Zetaproteobacteria bacterium]|nr:MAG: glucose-6-phosphate isomerase [Zetaproteobacteria bacterium]